MNPAASPRHPWKALAVVITAFALVHGARAHVFPHDDGPVRVHVGHAAAFDSDCQDIDVRIDDDADEDGPFEDLVDRDAD
jgi:hypothetical protein